MNTHRYTPKLIVEEKSNYSFNIPLYQRLFTWGEDQVKGLLLDLKEHFEKTDSDTPYYLGMLSSIGKGSVYDLIDGQQRFTVMTLLAIVLRQYDNRWEGFLDGGKRLHFVARPKDQEYLQSAISGSNVSLEETNEKMESAINLMIIFMKEQFDMDEARRAFASNTFERISFFSQYFLMNT